MRYLGGVAGTLVLGITLENPELQAHASAHTAALAAHGVALTSFCTALALAVGCACFLPGKSHTVDIATAANGPESS
jgi:hypothetical protein